jgi:hypothetical protein
MPHIMAAVTPRDCCQHAKKEGGQCPQPSKERNAKTDCCMNCPLCYVMLLPAVAGLAAIKPDKRLYVSFESSYQYTFYCSSWKPPNQG